MHKVRFQGVNREIREYRGEDLTEVFRVMNYF